MPEVTFQPIPQCAFDDSTEAAEKPCAAPRTPSTAPPCQPAVPGAEGSGGDACTDALVRRFSGEGGAPMIEAALAEPAAERSCLDETLRALSTCGPLLLVGAETPSSDQAAPVLACSAAVVALVECLTKNDEVR